MDQIGFEFGGEIVWRPTPEIIEHSRLKHFMDKHGIPNFDTLMKRSTTEIAWFWNAVLDDLNVEFYEPYKQIVDLSKGIAWPEWCVGGVMNIVHNCLDKYIGTPQAKHPALIYESEEGETRQNTYGELYREVKRRANARRSLGLKKGEPIGP